MNEPKLWAYGLSVTGEPIEWYTDEEQVEDDYNGDC